MSLRATNIVSQILCKDYDTTNNIILNLGGSEIFFSHSDTPTKGNADNESSAQLLNLITKHRALGHRGAFQNKKPKLNQLSTEIYFSAEFEKC